MKTANPKPSKPHDKNSYIMNIMSLKLSETSRPGQRKGSLYEQTSNISNLLINTPSTLATQKKFHSCQLHKEPKEESQKREVSCLSQSKHKGYESATKILTLQQMKSKSRLMGDRVEQERSLKKQKSRGIFVSVSRQNSLSKQKRKSPQFRVQSHMINQEPKIQQKLKVNVYKGIARSRNGLSRMQ